jgi:dipeptidyl aminopeptidase/acylaminoacyl peptidase
MLMTRRLLLLLGIPLATQAHAQARHVAPQPALIPIETLFSAPVAVDDAISPDGAHIAFLAPWRGRLNVYVRDASSDRVRRLTSDSVRSLQTFWWSADSKRVLYLQDTGGDERTHLFVRDVNTGSAPRDITPFTNIEVEVLSLPARAADVAVITLNRRNPALADAYRVNLLTGELTVAAENPGTFLGYVADNAGRVRVAYAVDSLGRYSLHTRATEQAAWQRVFTYAVEDRIVPLRFDARDSVLFMLSNRNTDLLRLVRVDLETASETVVHADPMALADAEIPVFSGVTGEPMLMRYDSDTLRTYALTAQSREMLTLLQRTSGDGRVLVNSISRDGQQWVVSVSSPDRSGRTWLVNGAQRTVTLLHRYRPALDRYALARTAAVTFRARDSLQLRGYLTVPRTRAAGVALPMVLLVHGGPWSRDTWDYQSDVQLLANRGYAVLQVNFRGSTGFGKQFARAAKHEFAQRMHTDLLDAVQWAVSASIADPQRVAIMGGSYGGYAALVGLTFTPRTFRCAVDYAGSSNLITLLEAFPPSWQPFLPRSWYPFVGDPRDSASRADMRGRSPLFRADSAIAPLLIFQGANDPRVTRAQSDSIALTLHRRGVPVTYLLAESEGHSFGEAETSLAVNRATELFLQRCLGGRAQPTVAPVVQWTLNRLGVDLNRLGRGAR